ncbi:MAG TPA: class GN sortase [Steroidobacteraceae bacterium]|nr:class GN sortase [Steroidobacteraceae bacterium]
MRIRSFTAPLLLALAVWQFGAAAYIHAKALLAQELLEHAWQRTLQGERFVRPWPWADIHPIARLRAPGQGHELIVLEGTSGKSLAFGPAHVLGTALPGAPGSAVVVGHRDTHFRFLRELRSGDRLEVERIDGAMVSYAVSSLRVVDTRLERLPLDGEAGSLRLITCYPFDGVRPGGPLRFEVTAKPEYGRSASTGVAARQRKLGEHRAESGVTILTKIGVS